MFITKLIKKGICIAAAAALFTASAPVLPLAIQTETEAYAAETPALPDHIMNGDFESPSVESIVGNLSNPNGSYNSNAIEAKPNAAISFTADSPWLVAAREIFEHASDNEFYWQTTAQTDRVELGTASAANMGSYWNGTLEENDQYGQPNSAYTTEYSAGSGDQFAELVAEEQASLYQNISTEPGSTLTWSLMHRARYHTDNVGKDTMALFIGPAQNDDLKKSSDLNTDKDLFMYMADKIAEQYGHNYEHLNTGMRGPYTVYSVEVTENTTITEDSVSTEYSDTHSQKWICWLMTSDYMQWQTYTDNYTVPEGQEATTLAFTSLTGAINEADTYNQGNCLDNIDFGVLYPLTVNAMAGGSGTVTTTTTDEDAVTSDVPEGGTFESLCAEDAAVTFTAEESDGYTFIGAYIDGVYHGTDEFHSDQSQHTYIESITMDAAHEITLMFAQNGYVTYDPNGGMFKGSDKPTSEEFDHYESQKEEYSAPTLDGAEFLGWKVYTIDGEAAQNELIPKTHSIEYTREIEWEIPPFRTEYSYWLTISYSNDKSLKLEASSDDAVLLVAQWSYGADAVACTMNFGETEYTCENTQGGSAEIDHNGSHLDAGDEFTLTAKENPGYSFKGWYVEQDGTESFVSDNQIYNGTFTYSESVTFHAHFSEIPLTPYLSAVAQDEGAQAALQEKGLTHGTVVNPSTGSESIYNNDTYGKEMYGSTISTGFFAKRSISGTGKISGIWTIDISPEGAYIKTSDPQTGLITDDAVVTDDEGTQENAGSIYPAGSGLDRTVRFFTEMDTEITNGTAVFGIIIDNLYAPNARAGFMATAEKPTEMPELNADNSVGATETKPYDQSELDALDAID